jgi:hypothetical protein
MAVDKKALCAEDSIKPLKKDGSGDGGWVSMLLLTLLLLVEAAALVTLSVWQEGGLAAAEQRLDIGERLLAELEKECGDGRGVNSENAAQHVSSVTPETLCYFHLCFYITRLVCTVLRFSVVITIIL